MIFKPAASRGGVVGLAMLAGLALLEAILVLAISLRPIGPVSATLGLVALGLVPLIARVALYVWGYFRLKYEVTRDGVIVHWAASRQQIPMAAISKVRTGRPYTGTFHGVRWPGYEVGHAASVLDDGSDVEVMVSATARPAGQVLLVGPGNVAYGLSPADTTAFIEEIKIRRRLGPVQELAESTVRPQILALPIWSDRITLRLLVAALVLNALLFALIAWRFPGVPATVSLRQVLDPVTGVVPGPSQPRSALWGLPIVGLGAVVLNSVLAVAAHHRARIGAALLAGGALMTQLLIAIALAWALR